MDEGTLRLLLEGRPGIGKTTVARRLLRLLQEAGVPLGGSPRLSCGPVAAGRASWSRPYPEPGKSSPTSTCPAHPRVGRYGVDLAAFDRVALPALRPPGTGGVVVVDELGKMELASAAFRDAVMQVLDRDVAVVATVQQARHQFTDALRRRPDIRVVRVTETTRDALPERLMDRLIGAPRGEER